MTCIFRNQKRRGGGGAVLIYWDPSCSGKISLTLVPHFFSWEPWHTRGAEESLHWKRAPCQGTDFVHIICIDHDKDTHGIGLLSVTQCTWAHVHEPIRRVHCVWVTLPRNTMKWIVSGEFSAIPPPHSPLWQPSPGSLCLWVCFCFVHLFWVF